MISPGRMGEQHPKGATSPGRMGEQSPKAMTSPGFIKLLDILPERLKTDEITALVDSLDEQLHEIIIEIDKIIIMPRIDEQPEEVVDLLAWQLHVDFYEPLGLSLDKKRALVKNSLLWHMKKGTKYVLEDMIRILFFENFKIEEWFEYGGRPAFFRLVAKDSLQNSQQYKDLIRAVYELKNERSWLDSLLFERESQSTIHFGQVGRHKSRYEIDGLSPKIKTSPTIINIGTVGRQTRKFRVEAVTPPHIVVKSSTNIGSVSKWRRKFNIEAQEVKTGTVGIGIGFGFVNRRTVKAFILSQNPANEVNHGTI